MSKIKPDKLTTRGCHLAFIPGEGATAKNAYVRIETRHKEIFWFDNTNLRATKKLHKWLTAIVRANK